MATATGYSAGRVFLQVVPSYKNFMKALRQDARGPLGKAIAETFEKELEKSGTSSGEAYGKKLTESIQKNVRTDALTADLKKKLGKALDDVGNDSSTFGRKLIALQKDIEQTGRVTDEHIKRQRALATEMLAVGEATESAAKHQRLLNAAGNLDPEVPKRYAAAQRDMARESTAAAKAEQAAERATNRRNKTTRDGERDTNIAARSLFRLSGILSGVRGDSQDGANAFRFFSFGVLAAASAGAGLVPILAAVAGGALALLPILAGLGAGAGVAIFGFSGLSEAVKALGAQQDATSGSSKAYARSLVNAARAVADARRSLKDAYRNSAESIVSAVERQRNAERSLADAQRDALQAQRDLSDAKKQAAAEAADLANQVAQNQLDERQGVIDLFNAHNQYGAVMADGGSTNLEREQADIALKQAQLNLKLIREEQKKLAAEKKKSDKEGIAGSKTVKTAEERLRNALERVADANRNVTKTTKEVARAREDAARTIADAQRALARAQEDYNSAAEGGAAATDQVTKAMEKLGPEGRRFARFLNSLRGGVNDLRATVQKGLLPGVQEAMETIISKYGPGFKAFLGETGVLLGDLAEKAGNVFTNDAFVTFFGDMADASQIFLTDFGDSMLNWLEGFANIMGLSLPTAEKFSGAIVKMSEGFKKWTESEKGRASVQGFLGYVERIGPKVLDFFGALASAVGRIGEAFAPIGDSVLTAFTALLDKVSKMDDKQIRQIGVGLAIIVIALQSAAGIMAVISLAAAVATAPLLVIVGAVAGLAGAFLLLGNSSEKNKKFFTDLMETLDPVIRAAKDLYKIFKDQLVKTWEEALLPAIKDIVKALKKDLLPAFERFWPVVKPLVKFIARLFGVILRGAIESAKDLILGIIKVLTGLMNFITGVFTGDWSLAWEGIKQIFFGIVEAIWGLINLYFFGKILGGFKSLFTKELPGILRRGGKFILLLIKSPFKLARLYFDVWKLGVTKLFSGFMRGTKKTFGGFKTIKDNVVSWMGTLKDKTLTALGALRDGVETIFKKIRKFMANPIIGAVDLVINKALIGGINRLAGWVGQKGKDGKGILKEVNLPKPYFNGGVHGVRPGYTPGRDTETIAVGGGEAIMRPEWTRAVGEGFVNRMNLAARRGGASAVRAAMTGTQAFAKGGVFWPTRSKNWTTYAGHDGIDLNGRGNGLGDPYFATADGKIAYTGSGRGYGNKVELATSGGPTVIYGHSSRIDVNAGDRVKRGQQLGLIGYSGNVRPAGPAGSHLHFGLSGEPADEGAMAVKYLSGAKFGGSKFKGALSKIAGLSKAALSALKNPEGWLKKRAEGGLSKIKGIGGASPAMDFFKGIPKKLIKGLAEKIKDMAMKGLDVGKKFFKYSPLGLGLSGAKKLIGAIPGIGGKGGPALYDNGGYLPPGLSMVMNKTSKPEPVLTTEQWDRMRSNGTGGGDTHWDITATGADPEQVATLLVGKINRQQRLAKRSGTLGRRGP